MEWLLLFLSILCELLATTMLKLTNGLTQILPTIGTIIFYVISFTLLAFVLKKIPVSIAYAIWSSVGTAVMTIIGIIFFKENINFIKVFSIFLIIVGVVCLNLSGNQH